MPLESLQCPRCGSPLLAESASPSCTCTYCGAELRLVRGSSGHILGVPAGSPAASPPLVRQLAVERLEERVQALSAEKQGLEAACQNEIKEAVAQYVGLRQVRDWVVVGSALLTVVGYFFQPWLATNVLVTVAALLAWPFVDRRRLRAEEEATTSATIRYEPAFAGIEQEIEQTREQIALLSRGLDGPRERSEDGCTRKT